MTVAMLLALHVFVTFKSVFLSILFGYYWFSYFDFKTSFLLVNNEENKKEKEMSPSGRRMYSMYARSDRGCKGELAQSQRRVPERSESSTEEFSV